MSSADDYSALRHAAGLVDRSAERGRLWLSGGDRRRYLQGLLTNDIEALAAGTGCYAAYLTAQGRMIADMRVFDVSPEMPQEVDPRDVPWERVEEDSFPYIVRQDAGPQNPLGQVKFMCPNEYDVYLHDTPSRRHFGYGSRFLSHGCVRVQDPMVLASYLLQDSPLSSPDSMLAIMADSTWRQVGLKRRVPVLIEYRTAWLDEAGVVQFRPDVYGLDQRLDAALKSGRLSGL